jgi:predicted Zn-dependent protease
MSPGGVSASLADMIAGTERGLLLTTLWYARWVDPTVLELTGLTRDGVFLWRTAGVAFVTRAAMPSVRISDFHTSSVSQAQ